jgi:hypothetical protein
MTDSNVERGAAEDGYGVPVTPTDVEASRTPPSKTTGAPDDDGGSPGPDGDQAGDSQDADRSGQS